MAGWLATMDDAHMSWLALTENHIKSRLALDELEAYTEAGKQDTQGLQIVDGIITQVVAMVRGKVAANRDNLDRLGAIGTIPDECLHAACTIARESLIGSLPISEGQSELRKEELRQANRFLDSVASGDVRIADDGGTYPEAETSTSPAYGGSTLHDF